MSGNKLLLDTNILIYLSKKEIRLEDFAGEGDLLHISDISFMEAKDPMQSFLPLQLKII